MFNPFEKLNSRIIQAFGREGKSFLVSQTFNRGLDPFRDEDKICLLFSHYGNISHARIHLSALTGDKYAAIIDLEKEEHRNKIIEMMRIDSKYVLYSSLIKSQKEVEQRMNKKYRDNLRRYINKNTSWRIPADEILNPQLDIAFGDLFIILKFRKQQIRFKLDELDKV